MPVWVAAAAKASMEALLGKEFVANQSLSLPDQEKSLLVYISSASYLQAPQAGFAIVHCDSKLALDLTRNLEIWTFIQWNDSVSNEKKAWLEILPGSGVGKYKDSGDLCISYFARELIKKNLFDLVPKNRSIKLEIVFPKGVELASRTSNKAFGVVDGLALIGTQAEAHASASPDQLNDSLKELRAKCLDKPFDKPLVLVIGENGLDLALSIGISHKLIVKIGNWIGPLLVAAAENGVNELLVFGYHGKLIKLAGGIFHTHHHLADARLEVISALAVKQGLAIEIIQSLLKADSIEAAFLFLESNNPAMAKQLWNNLALEVENRSTAYIRRYGSWPIKVGAALFDRQRKLRWFGPLGNHQLTSLGATFST